MTPAMDGLPLASEFPPATREQWRKLVDKVLKGAPFETLTARTADGIAIEALSERARNAQPVVGRTPGTPWRVMQRIDHPDPAASNADALHELENGATGLSLVFAGSPGARGFGLEASAATLGPVLQDVHLDAGISIELELSAQAADAPRLFADLLRQRGTAPAATDIRFAIAPLGAMLASGVVTRRWEEIAPDFARTLIDLVGLGFKGPFAVADSRILHDAGAAEAQELGTMLAVALTYLRTLEAHGVPLDAARRMVFFRMSADADQFLTMAKLRALRKLWSRVEEACGLTPEPIIISAHTAWRMMTRRDPHVNILRGTIAAAAAGLGGADAITVLPFTLALGLPDRMARRIARNTQLILLEESYLANVADPAAGSGSIEDLTQKLCVSGWAFFQEIEQAGGAWPAFEQGLVQRKIAETRAARQAAVKHGREPLVGTTIFANPKDVPAQVLDVAPAAAPSWPADAARIEALLPMRLAEPFE